MIRRIINLSAAFLATVLMLGLTASMASADVPGLSISQVGYNAVGADSYLNRNSEYVDIKASADTDVTGLRVQDSWRHATRSTYRAACNTFVVTTANVDPGLVHEDKVVLPAGHTLRVYVGSGTPAAFAPGGSYHSAYIDSKCGYHGHFLNNDRDMVWIVLGDQSAWKGYDFRRGYYIR